MQRLNALAIVVGLITVAAAGPSVDVAFKAY